MHKPKLLLALLLSCSLATLLPAQKRVGPKKEPTFAEALAQAQKAFEAKDYGAAMSSLQAAMQAVQKLQRRAILASMPRPAGFEFEDEGDQDAGANPFGASMAALGTTVSRKYTHESGKGFEIEVMANSPLVSMMGMMFSNPALATADGGEMIEYGKHKAILKKEGDDGRELTILMNGKHVVKVTSHGITDDELLKIFDQACIDAMEKPLGR
ncbi:MAG: hypothetical protein Fur0037_19850 [Planctomycetota bacterium]